VAAPATVNGVPAPNATGSKTIREGGAGDTRVSQETCRAPVRPKDRRWGGRGARAM